MTITFLDFEVFCRRSLTMALGVADRLGDERVNAKPMLTGGSTPFGLITHMLGAAEWWVGHILLGEPSDRDRDGEFVATGTGAELRKSVERWLDSLVARYQLIESATGLMGKPETSVPLLGEWTVGAVLLHVYEEIAQHLGHLEMTADIIEAEASR